MAVAVVMALGAALRLYRIGSQPLWVDEATSLQFAHLSLARLWSWRAIADAGNPPLYYSLLHVWVALGDREWILRLPSAILGTLTVPFVYALGRTIRDHRLGILSALIFAVAPFQVWYGQEARGYALLTLGAAAAMLGVAAFLRHPERASRLRTAIRPLLAYSLGTGVALLAHDTAVFLPIAANLLVLGWWLVHRRTPHGFLRTWIVAQIGALVVWSAWLPAYLRQLSSGAAYAWIPKPSARGVLDAVEAVAGGYGASPRLLTLLVVLALAAIGLWSWRGERRWIAFVVVFALAAPLGELAASLWRPVFLTRTLVWSGLPLCVAMAAGILAIRPRALASAALAALLVLTGLSLWTGFSDRPKEAWDQVAAYVDARAKRGDAIVFSVDFLRIPFDYYSRLPRDLSIPELGLPGAPDDAILLHDATATRRRVWLIVSHQRIGIDAVIAALGTNDQLVGFEQFVGVDVYLYDQGSG